MLADQQRTPSLTKQQPSSSFFGNHKTLLRVAAYVACLVVPLAALGAALAHNGLAWDDGAITAAFARTYHQTGRIALTPYSEVVEGFSSLLWMGILAAGDFVTQSTEAMLSWTKIASAIAFSLSLFSFIRLSKKVCTEEYAYVSVLLLALTLTPFREVVNGMEMNLYMLFAINLANVLLSEDDRKGLGWLWAFLLSCGVLLTRFEGPFLLFFLYAGVFLVSRRRMRLVLLALADALFFAAVEIWRFRTFGELLPNTIYAKRWYPYSHPGLLPQLISRYQATIEVIFVLAYPLAALLILWVIAKIVPRSSNSTFSRRDLWPLLASMTLGAFLLGLATGKNWGHSGRMALAFIPFLILAIVSACQVLIQKTKLPIAQITAGLIVGQALLWIVETRIFSYRNSISYAAVEKTGIASDELRRRLHQETLSAFIPDIGGASLCCEKLNILDSALLANTKLAHEGYAGLPAFLQTHAPDVIATHGVWAELGKLYTDHLLDGYGLVLVNGQEIYLRSELYHRLLQEGSLKEVREDGGSPCVSATQTPQLELDDVAYIKSLSRCIVVSP